MKRIVVPCLLLGAAAQLHAAEVVNCRRDSMGRLFGNYNAVQEQVYGGCVIRFLPYGTGVRVVPIGNNGGNRTSRFTSIGPASIRLQLFGAADNTLAGGKRGRQEVSNCFLTSTEFSKLPAQEQAFREEARDIYRDCAQKSPRHVDLGFTLRFNDTPDAPYTRWDAIVAQFHAVDDKDLYCKPYSTRDAATCNQNSGEIGRSARNVQAYRALIQAGARFEGSVQPPLSFRFKDGYFSIVATSSLTDSHNQPTRYSAAAGCNVRVNTARVGETKRCADTGKTVTVLYREKLGEGVIRPNEPINFRVLLKWPTLEDTSSYVVIFASPTSRAPQYVVADLSTPLGSYNDQFPYFKAGVYRQNGNATPVSVDLVDLINHDS
ncbi:hypothetical protein [Cupriavidus campinensis]